MKRLIAVLALAATYAAVPTFADEPCGTKAAPAWCAELSTGVATVITQAERREYALGGVALRGPLPAGFALELAADLAGVQDGGALNFRDPGSFRAVSLEGSLARPLGERQAFAVAIRGGTTLSVEGGIAAPVDPRLWTALADVSARLKVGTVRLHGGHDGTVGGWALGADIEIPVAGAPAIVASYAYPLERPDPSRPRPWVVTAGGRVRIASFGLAGLFR